MSSGNAQQRVDSGQDRGELVSSKSHTTIRGAAHRGGDALEAVLEHQVASEEVLGSEHRVGERSNEPHGEELPVRKEVVRIAVEERAGT